MMERQAEVSAQVTARLDAWVHGRSPEDYRQLLLEADTADQLRFELESNLIEAFATPFDRQDIYSLSNDMDKIVEYARSTLLEIEAFEVEPIRLCKTWCGPCDRNGKYGRGDPAIKSGAPPGAASNPNIRKVQQGMEEEYRAGMALLFKNSDPVLTLKYREVYHHIKDAEISLGYTTDTLHRIIMRLA